MKISKVFVVMLTLVFTLSVNAVVFKISNRTDKTIAGSRHSAGLMIKVKPIWDGSTADFVVLGPNQTSEYDTGSQNLKALIYEQISSDNQNVSIARYIVNFKNLIKGEIAIHFNNEVLYSYDAMTMAGKVEKSDHVSALPYSE